MITCRDCGQTDGAHSFWCVEAVRRPRPEKGAESMQEGQIKSGQPFEGPDPVVQPALQASSLPLRIRKFDTGATRDTDNGKLDYEGFLSPLVLKRFGEFMHKNRVQRDGSVRDSDNWQKGIPLNAYMKSGWRHFMEWWSCHRIQNHVNVVSPDYLEEALCALLFNVSGYLHELLKKRGGPYGTIEVGQEKTESLDGSPRTTGYAGPDTSRPCCEVHVRRDQTDQPAYPIG